VRYYNIHIRFLKSIETEDSRFQGNISDAVWDSKGFQMSYRGFHRVSDPFVKVHYEPYPQLCHKIKMAKIVGGSLHRELLEEAMF